MKITIRLISFFLVCVFLFFLKSPQTFGEKAAFEKMYWEDGKLYVSIDTDTFMLKRIESIPIEQIEAFAKKTYITKWQHRIKDDFLKVMSDFGNSVYFSIEVNLIDQSKFDF